jgi:hypothetical protein
MTIMISTSSSSAALEHHLMLRMIEGMTPNVPEKEALRAIREEQGLKAFLEARDKPFRAS